MTRRVFVLDTSVLLSNPRAMTTFGANDVVLPLAVVREVEAKRNDPELGGAARASLRALEQFRVTGGDLAVGVPVNSRGGILRIEVNHADRSALPDAIRNDPSTDARILTVAAGLAAEGAPVTLVSNDLPQRIVASVVCGIPAEEYIGRGVADSGYSGMAHLTTGRDALDALYRDKVRPASEIDPGGAVLPDLPVHTGLVMTGSGSSALGRVTREGDVALIPGTQAAFGVRGRSAEQRIALTHLLDPTIGIVSLGGPAGTGKSVLALAAALELVLERRLMKRIMVFRPVLAVGGQDLGFLPGTEEEKMSPWSAAVFDALRAITTESVIDEIRDRGMLEILPLTHIRGRTLVDSVVVLDEAQNLTVSSILTALTRLGENSRAFLLHDVAQRDNLRVGRHDGIATVVDRLKGDPEALFAHVTLTKSERSPLAALAARLLDDGQS